MTAGSVLARQLLKEASRIAARREHGLDCEAPAVPQPDVFPEDAWHPWRCLNAHDKAPSNQRPTRRRKDKPKAACQKQSQSLADLTQLLSPEVIRASLALDSPALYSPLEAELPNPNSTFSAPLQMPWSFCDQNLGKAFRSAKSGKAGRPLRGSPPPKLKRCSSAPALRPQMSSPPVWSTTKEQVLRAGRITCKYPGDGAQEYPAAFGAMPHLPKPQFASGQGLPARASPSPIPKVIISVKLPRAASLPSTPREEQPVAKLNALRRCALISGKARPRSAPMRNGNDAEGGAMVQLLNFTLGDLKDNDEVLVERATTMKEAREQAGTTCHATASLATRALEVVLAKLIRVRAFEAKIEAYRKARDSRINLIKTTLLGEKLPDVAADAAEFRDAIAASVHCDGDDEHDGDPEHADRQDWQFFIQNFGLPDKHDLVLQGRRDLKEGAALWAAAGIKIMQEFAETVLLPQEERDRRAAERREKRIFLKAFPETRDGVEVEEIVQALAAVQRAQALACSVGGVTFMNPELVRMQALEKDLQAQEQLLRKGAGASIKV